MKLNKILFLLGTMAIIGLNACSINDCGHDKDQFIENYNAFIDEVDGLDISHNDDDWKKYDTRLEKFLEECYEVHEEELTLKEQRRIWGKTVQYFYKRYGTGFLSELKNNNSDLNLKIKDHLSDIGNDLELTFNDIELNLDLKGEEIEALFNEFGSDIEKLGKKWGKKIEQLLDDKK